MKKFKLILPIILSLIFVITIITISIILLPKNITHEKYEYFSYIGSILTGFLGPLISIFGFYYLYQSFRDSNDQYTISNIITVLNKYESIIDSTVKKEIYNKKEPDGKRWKSTVGGNLIINIPSDLYVEFFKDEECRSQIDMMSEIIEIRKTLWNIVKNVESLGEIKTAKEIEEYYKIKYWNVVLALNDEKHYFTGKYYEFKNKSNFKNELEIIDNKCRDFYLKNQFGIIIKNNT